MITVIIINVIYVDALHVNIVKLYDYAFQRNKWQNNRSYPLLTYIFNLHNWQEFNNNFNNARKLWLVKGTIYAGFLFHAGRFSFCYILSLEVTNVLWCHFLLLYFDRISCYISINFLVFQKRINERSYKLNGKTRAIF